MEGEKKPSECLGEVSSGNLKEYEKKVGKSRVFTELEGDHIY